METFHLPACAMVGDIKMRIKDAILDGIIPNEYEAAREFMFRVAREMGVQQ
jgi:poly(A) polymerase